MKRQTGLVLAAIILVSSFTLGYTLYLQGQPIPTPPSQTPSPTFTSQSVGICVHSLSQTDANLIANSGADWIRIDCNDTAGDFNTSVRNAKVYNLSVLAILDSWMFDENCAFTLEAWQGNVTYYVTQYAPYVDTWEIWNEPTSTNPGWQLQTDYLSMVQIASPIIRQYDPTAKILLFGGLQLYTGGNTTLLSEDLEFARNLSTYNIMQYGDAISVHAYPWSGEVTQTVWEGYNASLAKYRAIIGNSTLDIWATETGQNISDCNEAAQAQYLSDSLSFFNGTASHVFWYALHDTNSTESDFGLVDADMQPRQAYNTLKNTLLGQ